MITSNLISSHPLPYRPNHTGDNTVLSISALLMRLLFFSTAKNSLGSTREFFAAQVFRINTYLHTVYLHRTKVLPSNLVKTTKQDDPSRTSLNGIYMVFQHSYRFDFSNGSCQKGLCKASVTLGGMRNLKPFSHGQTNLNTPHFTKFPASQMTNRSFLDWWITSCLRCKNLQWQIELLLHLKLLSHLSGFIRFASRFFGTTETLFTGS